MIHPGRWTAELDGDVVVFLIGARIHKSWKVRQWVPVARAMNAMQREIAEHPEIGCLHVENFGALRPISGSTGARSRTSSGSPGRAGGRTCRRGGPSTD